MSDFKPTASQAAAIAARGSAVLVSAGAGSGKTKVLTERLMGRITDPLSPADLDSFLVITFTRAAAGELKGRIMDELSAALAADPDNKRLRRQSALCQQAQIGTIHSFCAAILRENCHTLGLSPDFKIADDDRAAAMRLSAVERVMDAHYAAADAYPGFTLLADTVGIGRDDRRLSELVLQLHGKMQCHARPELWAKKQVELLRAPAEDVSQTPWGREVLDWAREETEHWAAELEQVMAAMEPHERICAAYMDSLAHTADAVRALRRALDDGWDSAKKYLPVPFPDLKRLTKTPDAQVSDYVKARRLACKKTMAGIDNALACGSAELLRELALTAPAMEALLELTLSFDADYARAKRRAGLVDYSDLEHLTARLLTGEDGEPTELARQISAKYTEIMVDEYQDVSRVQDAIFRAVSRDGRNLFMVGDVKQAIYRFRLADPQIFTEKYLGYRDYTDAGPGEARRILLQENFRSRREVLDCANSVFSACMSRALGDIDYDRDAALKYGAGYEGSVPVPELLLLDLQKPDDGEDSPDKSAAEAELVAAKIRGLMDAGVTVTDKGAQRALCWGDIAILLRSANNVGGAYRSALTRLGIPVAMGQGRDYFSSIEISAVMSLLAVLDNPHQDIPLIAVLRSPLFGFSPDRLSAIRERDRKSDFYTALSLAAGEDAGSKSFLERLSALRSAAPDLPAAELIWQLLNELDMLAIFSAMPDGERRRANLMELITLAERFEGSGYRGLHRFVLWLRRLSEKGQGPGGGDAGDAVQILSVHKSKGLEFPVVFLCDTARRFNKQDSRDTVLVHPQLGLGPRLTDTEKRVEYPTLARNAIKLRAERELLSEEMRLMYVALTRAKERLYITAALENAAQAVEKAAVTATASMSPQVLRQASAPVGWFISAALADGEEHIRLSLCAPAAEGPQPLAQEAPAEADGDTLRELERRLSFSYPFPAAQALPSKVTATELKSRAEADGDAESIAPRRSQTFRMPDLARAEKPATGAERGVATHLVLQYMDFAAAGSPEGIRGEIERLRAQKFISPREAAAVDQGAILRLFQSPLGQRMRTAEKLTREFKFSLLWDAEQVFGQAPGEQVLLQGVVDCCLEEDGALVIIDYKTDHVKTAQELARRAALYTPQLRAYSAALGRIYGKEVKECVLYFLSAGEIVKIPEKDLH